MENSDDGAALAIEASAGDYKYKEEALPALKWQDALCVGHRLIDQQHQQLFHIVDVLGDAMRHPPGAPDKLLAYTIAALYGFARTHFVAEEELMCAAYPGYLQHKRAHDALINRVEELESRLHNGEGQMATQIFSFLTREWLAQHIGVEDQRFSRFISDQVAQERPSSFLALSLGKQRKGTMETAAA